MKSTTIFRLCKFACRTFTNRPVGYRAFQLWPRNPCLKKPNGIPGSHACYNLYWNKPHISKGVFVALSILSWLGFTEEDEKKDSELITTLKRAVLCTNREQYDQAEQMLHLALRIAQQQQNEQGILYCYDLMANLAFQQHQFNKAEKLFVTVMQTLLGKGMEEDNLKIIHISVKLARICQLKAEMDKAEIGFQWCLEKIDKHKESSVDAKLLYSMINDWYAQFLLDKGNVEKSLSYLKEAYRTCNENENANRMTRVLILNDIAITSLRIDDLNSAETYLKEALKVGEDLEDKTYMGVMHANLGLILLDKGIRGEAERFCKEAWELGNRHKHQESMDHANYCFDQIKLHLGSKQEQPA